MSAAAVRDAWLSELLARPAYRIDMAIESAARDIAALARQPCFLFARVPTAETAQVAALEDRGFRVIDTALTFEIACDALPAEDGIAARRATAADRRAVTDIAGNGFAYSRFHLDPKIDRQVADRSRAQWAANWFDGTRGDGMAVSEIDAQVAAFVLVIGPADGVLTIDLVASHPALRRRGGARAAIVALPRLFPAATRIRVGTQAANLPSLRLYELLGFRTIDSRYVLHFHRT